MEEEIKTATDIDEEEIKVEETNVEDNEEVEEDKSVDINDKKEEKDTDQYFVKLQRTMAEFDNYRKRTDKEKSRMYDNGLIDTVESFLPVIDSFERALVVPCDDNSYVKGMELIYKQMLGLLESIGVTVIETENKTFDTKVHNAVMHIEDDDLGEGEIVKELQKGYIYKEDQVIRYSMVEVAN